MKQKKWLAAALIMLVLILSLAASSYLADYYRADAFAEAALSPSVGFSVEIRDDYVIFSPENPETGFLFYPGGKVEHTAYAPLMAALAEENILCVICRMPGNLAVLDPNAADGVLEQFPDVSRWFMGGHSLGGSMAGSYIAEHTDIYSGLVLLASYVTSDLSDSNLSVITLTGTEDQVMNRDSYDKYRENLPESTVEITLEGGNHAFFGSYGPQDGDGIPTLTVQEQTELTARHILSFFGK